MAKVIEISSDGGSSWNRLPGSNGNFNAEGEGIDDTILGQTFESQEVGLINWNVQADGIFKGFAGYNARLLKTGTPTSMTDEATAQEGATLVYGIVANSRTILDRSTAVVVNDNGSAVAAADIEWIDYLFGRVKFVDGYSVTGPITITADYLPTAAIGKGNGYTLTMSANAIDESDFTSSQGNGGYNVFASGLRTVELEINGIFDANEAALADLLTRAELICEIDPAGDGSSVARGYFKNMNSGQGGAVGAVEDETITFTLNVPDQAKLLTVFNWRHINTTLSTAITDILDSWLSESNTHEVRYLPSGVVGATPLDGKRGAFVVTDVSLSGGLSNMNVFNAELQGTGAVIIL